MENSSKKLPLSLVVITKNEESNIRRCLGSVPFASEFLVVDSFSTDKTCEVAQSLGAKVVQESWKGYGPQKKRATELARYDWILSLDADEALSPELQGEIQQKFDKLDPSVGYEFPRLSFHLGRWIHFGGWHPDWQLRLFNRQFSQWPDSQLHERVQSKSTQRLNHNILHWVFESFSDQVHTNDRYSTLQAQQMFDQGRRFSIVSLIFKPYSKFIELYFFKRGFLDGLAGFMIAVSAGYSAFSKWAKLWELEKKRGSK